MTFTTAKLPKTSSILPPWFLPCLALVVAVLAFYGNIYDNGLLYDDEYLIQKNTFIRDWHFLGKIFTSFATDGAHRAGLFYRPLQNLLYLIVYSINGDDLLGFHFLNVTLHAANACLVYVLGCKLGFRPLAVFLAALLWALHPVHVEAVTYLSATADPLYALFCLLGVIALLPDFTPRKVAIASALMILGLLSKETAVVFPLLATSCLYLISPQRLNPRTYLCLWPLWLIAFIYLVGRMILIHAGFTQLLNVDLISKAYGEHISLRTYTFLATLPSYAKLLLMPQGLHMDRDFPVYMTPWHWQMWLGIFVLLTMAAQIIWGRGRRELALSWGFLWCAGAYFPQTGIFMPINSLLLEHWLYLPSVGLALGIAQTLATAVSNIVLQRTIVTLALMATAAVGVKTYQQNKIWHDPFVFYSNILDHGETSVRAHNNLGIAYMDSGDYDHAMEQFQLAIKEHDLVPESHQNIASLISKMPGGPQHINEQIAELKRALELDPGFLPANEGLESIYTYIGDKKQAAYYHTRVNYIRTMSVP